MSLLFNMKSRFVTAFLPRSKLLLISLLHSQSAEILETKKIKSVTVSTFSPSICYKVMGLDGMIIVFLFIFFPTKFYLGRPGDRGPAPKRRCLASWWWSMACAGDGGPGGAVGTWSWNRGTAWPLVGGICWLRSPPLWWSGLNGPGLSAGHPCLRSTGWRHWRWSGPGIPDTCCGCRCGSHSVARCRSSSLAGEIHSFFNVEF